MKIFKDIQKVGFRDWFWFRVVLRSNEFHPRLNRDMFERGEQGAIKCIRVRDRAHRIDMLIG